MVMEHAREHAVADVVSNIGRAVASCLGPTAATKVVFRRSEGKTVMCRDAASLLSAMSSQRAVFGLVREAAILLEKWSGDGTTSLVLLIGFLLSRFGTLILRGANRSSVLRGVDLASSQALCLAQSIESSDGDPHSVLLASLATKLPFDGAFVADLLQFAWAHVRSFADIASNWRDSTQRGWPSSDRGQRRSPEPAESIILLAQPGTDTRQSSVHAGALLPAQVHSALQALDERVLVALASVERQSTVCDVRVDLGSDINVTQIVPFDIALESTTRLTVERLHGDGVRLLAVAAQPSRLFVALCDEVGIMLIVCCMLHARNTHACMDAARTLHACCM